MRVLDVFLLHCLLSDSPPDTPEEIAALKHNQHLAAERGREPGLRLACGGAQVLLADWGARVLAECEPIAAHLDALQGGEPGEREGGRVLEEDRAQGRVRRPRDVAQRAQPQPAGLTAGGQ